MSDTGAETDDEPTRAQEPLEATLETKEEHWVQDAASTEHFVRKCTEELLGNPSLMKDAEASLLVRRIHERAGKHIDQIEELLSQQDEEPSALRQTVAEGLGAALAWVERIPNRGLVQVVRDVYVALNYAAAGYHVLYTRAMLLERPAAARLALEHLRDYTPAIRRLSQLLAWASALELPLERWHDTGTIKEIVATLFESWSADVPFEGVGRS